MRKGIVRIIFGIGIPCLAIVAISTMFLIAMHGYNQASQEVEKLNSEIALLQSELESSKNKLASTELSFKSQIDYWKINYNSSKTSLQSQIEAATYYMSQAEYWKKKFMDSDSSNVAYTYSFDSVKELTTTIKKTPYEYINKQIKVIGTIYKDSKGTIWLFDGSFPSYNETDGRFLLWISQQKESGSMIQTVILNELLYAVLDKGDYVKLYGTITLRDGELYLDYCDYSIVKKYDE